jgi:hypothetical protein
MPSSLAIMLGNDPTKALHYVRQATAQAVNRAAYSEARNLVDAGLRVFDKVPDDRARSEAELWLRTVESTVGLLSTAPPPNNASAQSSGCAS